MGRQRGRWNIEVREPYLYSSGGAKLANELAAQDSHTCPAACASCARCGRPPRQEGDHLVRRLAELGGHFYGHPPGFGEEVFFFRVNERAGVHRPRHLRRQPRRRRCRIFRCRIFRCSRCRRRRRGYRGHGCTDAAEATAGAATMADRVRFDGAAAAVAEAAIAAGGERCGIFRLQ